MKDEPEKVVEDASLATEPIEQKPETHKSIKKVELADGDLHPQFDTQKIYSTASPVSSGDIEILAYGAKQNLWQRLVGQARAYLAEYAVLLIVIGTLISVTNFLFGGIVDSFGPEKQSWYWSGKWAYTTSLGALATVIALVPILLLLSKRTTGSEELDSSVKNIGWRKAFLGIFLILTGLTAVGYAIGFMFVVVSAMSNAGLGVEANTKIWQALVKDGYAALLFGLSAFLYARDYRNTRTDHYAVWRRVHRYAVVGIAVLLSLIFIFVPLKKQRGAYLDDFVVGDIDTLTLKISSYASDKRSLPGALSDLTLDNGVKTRIKSFNYEYKHEGNKYDLCATFHTDASNKKQNVYATALYGSESSSGASLSASQKSPAEHGKGYQCFSRTVNAAKSSSTTKPDPYYYDNTYDDYNYDYN